MSWRAATLACFATLMHRRFDLAPLHQQIIEQLERVEAGTVDRLMLFMPPRHGKSLISSELFPAWYLGRHPDRSVIPSSCSPVWRLCFPVWRQVGTAFQGL